MAKAVDWRNFYGLFGIGLEETSGGQYIGDCPFTDKANKFFVNTETGLWDSKVAGMTGNHITFFRKYGEHLLEQTSPADFGKLSDNRKLPVEAFLGKVLFNPLTDQYLIPAYNHEGNIVDLCRWSQQTKRVMRSPGSELQLMFSQSMQTSPGRPVFVCEGEWDAIALQWLIDKTGQDAAVVAVPGAGTFKPSWVPSFKDRDVYLCYDNDDAGAKGEEKASNMLRGTASSISFIEWPEGYPAGYDVRDFILDAFGKVPFDMRKCKRVRQGVERLCTSKWSRSQKEVKAGNGPASAEEQEEALDVPSFEELTQCYRKWLKMDSMDPLIYIVGTCFANRILGDPIWSFLVAPPGGMKTALLMTLAESEHIMTATTLKSSSLISGMKMPNGEDPSLIPKLDGKVLIVKDFTTILTMNSYERDEIFGVLRDCYDGFTEKMFGNGLHRAYESYFGMLAGVTPSIDSVQALNSSMGERFIKFRMDKELDAEDEEERLLRVLQNVDKEKEMRDELRAMGKRILSRKMPEKLPSFAEHALEMTYLARFTAKLRGAVTIDKFSREMIGKPIQEIATRLTKVYSKLGIGMAVFLGNDAVGDEEMRVLRQIAIDTIPEMQFDIFRVAVQITNANGKFCLSDILAKLRTTETTTRKVVEDFRLLSLVDRIQGGDKGLKTFWRVSDSALRMIRKANLKL